MPYRDLILQLNKSHKKSVLKLVCVRGWGFAMLCILVLAFVDATLALDDTPRFSLLLVVIALTGGIAVVTYFWERRARSPFRMLVRRLEERNPEIQNSLINAADFEEMLSTTRPSPLGLSERPSPDLMREEIRFASFFLERVDSAPALEPSSLKRDKWAAAGLCTLFVILLISSNHLMFSVLPRLFLPFADYPPYCDTLFDVDPKGAKADYGGNLKVTVKTSGRIPQEATLAVRVPGGKELAQVSMFDEGKGVFFQTLENLEQDLEYYVRIPHGRSKRYPLIIRKSPRILETVVTYTYPEYTRLKPVTQVLSERVLKGYLKTEVRLSIVSNRFLQGGEIDVAGLAFRFTPIEQNKVEARFPLVAAGRFSATIMDVDANTSTDRLEGRIEIVPDEKPLVVISNPGMDSFAVPDARVPISVEASDDLGVKTISFFRDLNGENDVRKDLYTGEGSERIAAATEILDLEEMKAVPGDIIEYYATATDTQQESPQTAASSTFKVKVISFEEYRDFAQSQMTATDLREKYEEILNKIEDLAQEQKEIQRDTEEIRSQLDTADQLPQPDQDKLADLEKRQEKLKKAAEQLSGELAKAAQSPPTFDIEKDYKKALQSFTDRLNRSASQMQLAKTDLGDASGEHRKGNQLECRACMSSASQFQQRALDELNATSEEFKKGIQQAGENLEKVMDLIGDTQEFISLYIRQNDLERQIRSYKSAGELSLEDKIRLKELSQLQDGVRDQLEELKISFRVHAGQLEELTTKEKTKEGLP